MQNQSRRKVIKNISLGAFTLGLTGFNYVAPQSETLDFATFKDGRKVDVVLLETNDGRPRLQQALQVFEKLENLYLWTSQ